MHYSISAACNNGATMLATYEVAEVFRPSDRFWLRMVDLVLLEISRTFSDQWKLLSPS